MKNESLITLIFFSLFIILSNGCKDKEEITPAKETGTVTDLDGNVYKTVKIGNQWWMAENLKATQFRNGKMIPKAQSLSDWMNRGVGYCVYDNNDQSPGLLYNYYVVDDANQIAPAGWHIPTDDEWKQLELFLGMSNTVIDKLNWRGTNEGDKLKIEGPKGWSKFENVWGTNESGFTALAGSCRMFNGVWGDPGLFSTGFWWTSTTHGDTNEVWYRYLDYKNSNIFRFYGAKNYGFSIRCVKD